MGCGYVTFYCHCSLIFPFIKGNKEFFIEMTQIIKLVFTIQRQIDSLMSFHICVLIHLNLADINTN